MRFFFPDSQDQICPGFDFEIEEWPADRVRQRDDLYAHEVLGQPAYSGILLSKSAVEGIGPGQSGRYSFAQVQRLKRVGVREFFRLDTAPGPRLEAFGDCGAFSYVNEEVPPYTVDEVIDFYEECRLDAGVSLDHMISGHVASDQLELPSLESVPEEWRRRQEMTLTFASEFINRHKVRGCRFEPVGVAQGWSPRSYAVAAEQLERMGFRRIGLGGLVPISRFPDRILACLEAVTEVRSPETRIHLFGIAHLEQLDNFSRLGVESFDSTSPFRRAFKDDKNNYYASGRNYVAIRVPQVEGNSNLKKKIAAGEIDQAQAIGLEKSCMDLLRRFDSEAVSVREVLSALEAYQVLWSDRKLPVSGYEEVLGAKPWKECPCMVCQTSGIQVMIFRGTERNKRRGFHNLFVFHNSLREQSEL